VTGITKTVLVSDKVIIPPITKFEKLYPKIRALCTLWKPREMSMSIDPSA
jgi:hypothetical protein